MAPRRDALYWCAAALAGELEGSREPDPVHARASLGAGLGAWTRVEPGEDGSGLDVVPGPAATLRAGVALADPLWVELEGTAAVPVGAFSWAPRVQLAVVGPLAAIRPGLSAGLGLQGTISADTRPEEEPTLVAHWGASLGFPIRRGPYVVRIDARHVAQPDEAGWSHDLVGTVGVERLIGPRPRAPEVAEEAPAPTAPPTFTIRPASAQVWISHPVCAWVPASDAVPILRARATGPVTVVAPGYLPVTVDPASVGEIELQRAPAVGSLAIAAAPGDQVRVDGLAVAVDEDGVAVREVREGPVVVQVVGGGRTYGQELAAAEGYGLWVRVPPPPVWEVRFAANSAALGADGRARLAPLVEKLGDASYVLVGSHSEEGTAAANDELALRRATAVRDALVAAGLPPDRVRIGPSRELDRATPEEERVVLVQTVAR